MLQTKTLWNGQIPWNRRFPESLYPPNNKEFGDCVQDGLNLIPDNTFLVVGLARDCEKTIIPNIERFMYALKDVDFFIVENDSKDKTVELLSDARLAGYPINFLAENYDYPRLQDKSLLRRTIMSRARNKYIDHINSWGHFYDFIIVYDFDIIGGFSYEGLAESISYLCGSGRQSVITANGLYYRTDPETGKYVDRVFYDTWAFSPYESLEIENYNLLRFNRGEKLYRVRSNFGGMAIYPYAVFDKALEKTHNLYENYDCDHVTFHEKLECPIYLNPNLITIYNEHYYANFS